MFDTRCIISAAAKPVRCPHGSESSCRVQDELKKFRSLAASKWVKKLASDLRITFVKSKRDCEKGVCIYICVCFDRSVRRVG